MTGDVLTQREVDALLSSLDSGQIAQPPGGAPPRSGLPYYDFKRPERISKDQMRAIETLHEPVARNLGASLSGELRTMVDCKLASVEQLTYAEFIMQLPNPTCFYTLSAQPLEGKIVLEFNPSIVFPIIDKLLGGQARRQDIPDRPLTSIERGLIDRITNLAIGHLTEAWKPVKEMTLRIEDHESNPQLLPVAPPNDGVVLVVFELRTGAAGGQMNVCLPYATMDAVLELLSDYQRWVGTGRHRTPDPANRSRLERGLHGAVLEVVAELARTRMSVAELLDLETGDILTTDQPREGAVSLRIAGRVKFLGKAGTLHGHKAVNITARIKDESHAGG